MSREEYQKGYDDGYLKGIDEFARWCKGDIMCQTFGLSPFYIDKIAEKLKGGVNQ